MDSSNFQMKSLFKIILIFFLFWLYYSNYFYSLFHNTLFGTYILDELRYSMLLYNELSIHLIGHRFYNLRIPFNQMFLIYIFNYIIAFQYPSISLVDFSNPNSPHSYLGISLICWTTSSRFLATTISLIPASHWMSSTTCPTSTGTWSGNPPLSATSSSQWKVGDPLSLGCSLKDNNKL